MNITIKTATVTVENREVPLTRAMVNQLEHWQSFRFKPEEIKVVGTVSLPDTVTYLIMTPVGLQRSNHLSPDREGVKDAPRIILTK